MQAVDGGERKRRRIGLKRKQERSLAFLSDLLAESETTVSRVSKNPHVGTQEFVVEGSDAATDPSSSHGNRQHLTLGFLGNIHQTKNVRVAFTPYTDYDTELKELWAKSCLKVLFHSKLAASLMILDRSPSLSRCPRCQSVWMTEEQASSLICQDCGYTTESLFEMASQTEIYDVGRQFIHFAQTFHSSRQAALAVQRHVQAKLVRMTCALAEKLRVSFSPSMIESIAAMISQYTQMTATYTNPRLLAACIYLSLRQSNYTLTYQELASCVGIHCLRLASWIARVALVVGSFGFLDVPWAEFKQNFYHRFQSGVQHQLEQNTHTSFELTNASQGSDAATREPYVRAKHRSRARPQETLEVSFFRDYESLPSDFNAPSPGFDTLLGDKRLAEGDLPDSFFDDCPPTGSPEAIRQTTTTIAVELMSKLSSLNCKRLRKATSCFNQILATADTLLEVHRRHHRLFKEKEPLSCILLHRRLSFLKISPLSSNQLYALCGALHLAFIYHNAEIPSKLLSDVLNINQHTLIKHKAKFYRNLKQIVAQYDLDHCFVHPIDDRRSCRALVGFIASNSGFFCTSSLLESQRPI